MVCGYRLSLLVGLLKVFSLCDCTIECRSHHGTEKGGDGASENYGSDNRGQYDYANEDPDTLEEAFNIVCYFIEIDLYLPVLSPCK